MNASRSSVILAATVAFTLFLLPGSAQALDELRDNYTSPPHSPGYYFEPDFYGRHLEVRNNSTVVDFINTYGLGGFAEACAVYHNTTVWRPDNVAILIPNSSYAYFSYSGANTGHYELVTEYGSYYMYVYVLPEKNCSQKLAFLEDRRGGYDGNRILWIRQVDKDVEFSPMNESEFASQGILDTVVTPAVTAVTPDDSNADRDFTPATAAASGSTGIFAAIILVIMLSVPGISALLSRMARRGKR